MLGSMDRWLPGAGGAPDGFLPRPGEEAVAQLSTGFDDDVPDDPEIPLPYGLRASASLLRRAGQELRSWPVGVRLSALSRVARSWLDPADPLRREAEEVLPAELGFTVEMVRWALDASFGAITTETLTDWWARDGEGTEPGPSLSAHIWSGNVFVAGLPPVVGSLLAGVPALIKAPSRHPTFASLFARSLAFHAPELGPCVGAASWPREDERTTQALLDADVVYVFGDDSTVDAVRGSAPESTRVAGFGHRVSVGLVGAPLDDSELVGLLEDCFAYDGGGCLTPKWVFAVGDARQALALARRASVLAPGVAARLPALPLTDEAAAHRAQYLGVAGFAGWAEAGSGWCVSTQPALEPEPPPRTLCFVPVPGVGQVLERLSPLAHALQGAVVGGSQTGAGAALMKRVSLSASPGMLQRPPLGWDHDGVEILKMLRS